MRQLLPILARLWSTVKDYLAGIFKNLQILQEMSKSSLDYPRR
jgi:hypothetical protein